MQGLTKRQRELVDYIYEFINNNRYSPSYREIAERFGFQSLGTVYKHVNVLKRKGVLHQDSKTSRSISPVKEIALRQNREEIEIPYIGCIAAGGPVQMFSQTEKMGVPSSLVSVFDRTYALRVKGDFLKEELIADGDIILVEVRQDVLPGETVIALINGDDTIVKKYYAEGDHVRLLSICSQHHPILLRQKDIVVQGVVVGILRSFE